MVSMSGDFISDVHQRIAAAPKSGKLRRTCVLAAAVRRDVCRRGYGVIPGGRRLQSGPKGLSLSPLLTVSQQRSASAGGPPFERLAIVPPRYCEEEEVTFSLTPNVNVVVPCSETLLSGDERPRPAAARCRPRSRVGHFNEEFCV